MVQLPNIAIAERYAGALYSLQIATSIGTRERRIEDYHSFSPKKFSKVSS